MCSLPLYYLFGFHNKCFYILPHCLQFISCFCFTRSLDLFCKYPIMSCFFQKYSDFFAVAIPYVYSPPSANASNCTALNLILRLLSLYSLRELSVEKPVSHTKPSPKYSCLYEVYTSCRFHPRSVWSPAKCTPTKRSNYPSEHAVLHS